MSRKFGEIKAETLRDAIESGVSHIQNDVQSIQFLDLAPEKILQFCEVMSKHVEPDQQLGKFASSEKSREVAKNTNKSDLLSRKLVFIENIFTKDVLIFVEFCYN